MKTGMRLAFALGCIVSSALLTEPAAAQPDLSNMVPPRRVTDARGVDLVSGRYLVNVPLVRFGDQATGLAAWIETDPGAPPPASLSTFLNNSGYLGGGLRPRAYAAGSDGSPDEFGSFENIVAPSIFVMISCAMPAESIGGWRYDRIDLTGYSIADSEYVTALARRAQEDFTSSSDAPQFEGRLRLVQAAGGPDGNTVLIFFFGSSDERIFYIFDRRGEIRDRFIYSYWRQR